MQPLSIYAPVGWKQVYSTRIVWNFQEMLWEGFQNYTFPTFLIYGLVEIPKFWIYLLMLIVTGSVIIIFLSMDYNVLNYTQKENFGYEHVLQLGIFTISCSRYVS